MKVYKGQQLYYYNKSSHSLESISIILVADDGQSFAVRWNDDVVWRSLDSIGKTLFLSPKECCEFHGVPFVKMRPRKEYPRGEEMGCTGGPFGPRDTSWGDWRNQNALGITKKKKY